MSLRKQADASRRWQKCDSQKRTQAAEGGNGRQKQRQKTKSKRREKQRENVEKR